MVELENDKVQIELTGDADVSKKKNYKEDRERRNKVRNFVRQAKKEMTNLERAMEKLKSQAETIQAEIDSSSEEGWSVLADLTSRLETVNMDIEDKELRWLELAEELEEAEDE